MKEFGELSNRTQVAHMRAAALAILDQYPIELDSIRLVTHAFNTSFRVDTVDGRRFALRINVNSDRTLEHVVAETAWVSALADEPEINVARLQPTIDGAPVAMFDHRRLGRTVPAVLYSWLRGRNLGFSPSPARMGDVGRLAARLHGHGERWRPPGHNAFNLMDSSLLDADDNIHKSHPLLTDAVMSVLDEAMDRMEAVHRDLFARMMPMPLHGDLHGGNLKWLDGELSVFDFDDAGFGLPVQDLAISAYYIRDAPALEAAMLAGYAEVRPLPDVSDLEYETLVASRNLLLLNELLVIETAVYRDMLPQYLSDTIARLSYFLDTGQYRRTVPT